MDAICAKDATEAMAGHIGQQDRWSVLALAIDTVIYFAGIILGVFGGALWIKISGVLLAGTATSTLFVLGHDAAHRSLFKSRCANTIIGRLVFFPCLHNHTLWLYQHNHLHHQQTNVRGLNSFSPMSPDEFNAASRWRRAIERLYRSPAGFGIYYLIERWWKHKFFPARNTPASMRRMAALDLALLLTWTGSICAVLYWAGIRANYSQPAMAILWGFVLPFVIWNQLMGLTAFVQHTHPRAYWLRQREAQRGRAEQAKVTVDVHYPAWYDLLSHNIMVHPAHHVNPRIPWYRLKAAQRELDQILGADIVVARMTPKFLWSLCRECQLYDYVTQQWLSFNGRRTNVADRAAMLIDSAII